ncbi:hypothetical protein VKT23_017887 [Stygiomarasmius scandens]|uniref:Cytochrome P450 n=1 Tax=Marasmiellus scandens TaxID=2682957 RepID=A0ABR1IUW3_9AGAR
MLQRSASDLTADYVSQLLTSAEDKDPLVIRDTLVTLLFAGRDNTHNSLNWSMHSLLRHPEWLKRMRDEAIKLNSYGMLGTPFVKLNEYHIHQAVFYETVRLWPGIPKNLRQAVEDDILPALPELELSEVKIMKGDYVLWSDYYMMRHHSLMVDISLV